MERDAFEAAYTAGVVEAAPAPAAAEVERRGPREVAAQRAAEQPFALKGCVLTPERKLDPGYVVVEAGVLGPVSEKAPQGVTVSDTGGVICPGLIDLHGHPEFNVFAAWEPPKQFDNRYAWRDSALYHQLVRDPQNKLAGALPPWTQLRYAEVRALIAGVTAIQGSGKNANQYQDEALVRNVDKWIFGGQVGRAMIDLPSGGQSEQQLASILKEIDAGTVKAFYIHLAEGKSSNPRSVGELDKLVGLKGLTKSTVLIHATALSEGQLGDVHDAGAKLVWSPQSNLRLYGETTKAAHALEIGVPMGLGADWLPSGSTSLLAELKVARRCLSIQASRPADVRKLVDIVTRDAAAIAGLEDKLGTLAEGRPADIAVFERHYDDPWENVVMAEPSWVELVMIGGDVAYGTPDLVRQVLGSDPGDRYEPQLAWGKPMLLDTSYQAHPDGDQVPSLSELRAALIGQYPQVGPIYA